MDLPPIPACVANDHEPAGLSWGPATLAAYGRAFGRWLAAGRPCRSPEEVDRVYRTVCRPCAYFLATKSRCKICGCRVNAQRLALANKIAMGTEHCPKRKW